MKGFISYSHYDITMCGELRKHLRFLEWAHGIVFWADDDIRGGDLWDPRILEAVNEADIFLMLCSPNWLNSGYIQERELPAIHARVACTRCLVLPVVLVKPSVPTRLRHLPPGSLDPEVLKDRLSHAHARHRNLCRGGWRLERRP